MLDTSAPSIKPIDNTSVHRITSGQVVIDLQTAVKELVENSLDAGANSIEVRFKEYGLTSIEVIDNGSGIPPEDYDTVALKHHTSKLEKFEDLMTVQTFGFRGEALSSLCALCTSVSITTATAASAPMGTVLAFDRAGRVTSRDGRAARQRGTTVTLTGLFKPLAVRRKELERNAKAGAIRFSVSNQPDGGKKTVQLRVGGGSGLRANVSALWGPKALDPLVDLDLKFIVEPDKTAMKRLQASADADDAEVQVKGLISKFALGCGRTGADRQFFYVNGRPCALPKVQKAINEVYRTYNINQAPFVVADFIIPTETVDINVSPDKRTLFLHSEVQLVEALKVVLEATFAQTRSTYGVNATQAPLAQSQLGFAGQRTTADGHTLRARRLNATQPEMEDNADAGPSEPQPEPNQVVTSPTAILDSDTNASPTENDTTHDIHRDTSPKAPAVLSMSSQAPLVSHPEAESTIICRAGKRSYLAGGAPSYTPPAAPTPPLRRSTGQRPVTRDLLLDQTVLSTAGATWSALATSKDDITERKTKRARLGGDGGKVVESGEMRSLLRGFAREGAAVPTNEVGDGEEEGAESEEGGNVEKDVESAHRRDDGTPDVELSEELLLPPTPSIRFGRRRPGSNRLDEDLEDETQEVDVPTTGSPARVKIEDQTEETAMVIDLAERDAASSVPVSSSPGPSSDVYMDSEDLNKPMELPLLDTQANREVVRTVAQSDNEESRGLHVALDRIQATWANIAANRSKSDTLSAPSKKTLQNDGDIDMQDANPLVTGLVGVEESERAERLLSRVIEKADFEAMEILGQFNKGFIVARLRKGGAHDDLFIVDQHAADEKYNFETLQQTTKIQSQKLFKPRPLELSAADELVARDNLELLRLNGFELQGDGEDPQGASNDEDDDLYVRHGLHLVAQPMSKNVVFDIKDLEEIIHILNDRPASSFPGGVVRCSKARAMFASRACRKSVMVGHVLEEKQMNAIVRHMGTMEHPWNCPHGRPTMRHLVDLASYHADGLLDTPSGNKRFDQARPIDWSTYAVAPTA